MLSANSEHFDALRLLSAGSERLDTIHLRLVSLSNHSAGSELEKYELSRIGISTYIQFHIQSDKVVFYLNPANRCAVRLARAKRVAFRITSPPRSPSPKREKISFRPPFALGRKPSRPPFGRRGRSPRMLSRIQQGIPLSPSLRRKEWRGVPEAG